MASSSLPRKRFCMNVVACDHDRRGRQSDLRQLHQQMLTETTRAQRHEIRRNIRPRGVYRFRAIVRTETGHCIDLPAARNLRINVTT